MEHLLNQLLGLNLEDHTLLWHQVLIRAILVFFITLLFIRITGMRIFGKKSSFDIVVGIILGALLSRTIIGASPFVATILAALVFVILHRLMAFLTFKYHTLGKIIKGTSLVLFDEGVFYKDNMKQVYITEHDLSEAIREKANARDFSEIDKIYFERDGELSVVKK